MRLDPAARRTALGGLALAVALAAASTAFHRQYPPDFPLVSPAACSGAQEWLAVTTARLLPALALGTLFARAQPVLLTAAFLPALLLVLRISGRWPIAIAVGLTLASLTVVAPVLEPFAALPLAVTATAILVLSAACSGRTPRGSVLVVLAVSAAVVPASTLPLAVLAAILVRQGAPGRTEPAWIAAAVAVAIAGVLPLTAVPHLDGTMSVLACATPRAWTFGSLLAVAGAALREIGPYGSALAAFGLAGLGRRARSPAVLAATGYVCALVLPVITPSAEPRRVVAAITIATLMAAALGLREVTRHLGAGARERVGAGLLTALVPLLAISTRAHEARMTAVSFGHFQLSLNGLSDTLSHAAPGSALVVEDAIVDVLLRAREARTPAVAHMRLVPRKPFDVYQALATGMPPLLALPLAQLELEQIGVRVRDLPDAPPLARLEHGGQCRPLRTAWRPLPDLAGADAITFAGPTEADQGPLVLYVLFDRAPEARPMDWPRLALRGYYVTQYAVGREDERAALETIAGEDGAPLASLPMTAASHVLRLEQWRTPGAPLALTTEVRPGPVAVIGRVLPGDPPDLTRRLTICPAFPHEIRSFGSPAVR